MADGSVDELTVLEVYQAATCKLYISHRAPRCDIRDVPMSQKYLVIMDADGMCTRDIVPEQ